MAAAKPIVLAIAFLLAAAATIAMPEGGGDLPPYTLFPAEPPTVSMPDGGGKVPPLTFLPADPAATGCRGSVGMCQVRGEVPPGLGKGAVASTMSVDTDQPRRRVHHQQRDSVPCSRRGASYYNCRPGSKDQDSPYRKSCSRIKQCHG